MRLSVNHETTYRYAEPARAVIQHLRMTPRRYDGFFIRKWRVEIDADCRLDKDEDAAGNLMHTFYADGPLTELRISVQGDVETSTGTGLVSGTIERLPVPVWQRETILTHAGAAIAEFANDIASGEGGDRLATLHAINGALFRSMTFAPGNTDHGTTAEQAFAARAGVCQDFAHLFLAAARHLGFPARYVSGYYLRTDTTEQEAGHAWAEAHVSGLGWIAFDPAHDVCPTDRYVRVAIGHDAREASPIRGARMGGDGEVLMVSVSVKQGPTILDV
ncbi:MAG: transglutaminase family protein [Proteobacteria bacterium]|nr:transglutaminase family protein [Pseudomonadota bacterium]